MPTADLSNWTRLGAARGTNYYQVNKDRVDMSRPPAAARPITLRALPQELIIDLGRSALIVVDMQNDFCARDGWIGQMGIDVSPALGLAPLINNVTASLRAASVPVLWINWGVRQDRLNLSPSTQHPFNPHGAGPGLAGPIAHQSGDYRLLERGSWGARIISDLVQHPSDIHVDKHRISGFWDTPLDAILRNLDVKTLLFAGVNTDHCVLGTLMDANFHGYDTILLQDCTSTTSPQFCYDATLHNVRFCFGFTATTHDLVTAVREGGSAA